MLEDEEKSMKKAILDLAAQVNALKFEIEDKKEKMNVLKEEIRGLMQELGLKRIENDEWRVTITYPRKVDAELLYRFHKDIFPLYATREIVKKEVFKWKSRAKDKLKKEHPKVYDELDQGATPRLRIENIKPVPEEEYLK